MPEVIDQTLFAQDLPVPPGERVESERIDVRGAQFVTVNVMLDHPRENVSRGITVVNFTDTGAGNSVGFQADAFGQDGRLLTTVPVHGSSLQVVVSNNGSDPVKIFAAWIYGVREAVGPAVIDKALFAPDTPIPPGESIETPLIDVRGAQHVTVNTLIGGHENVQRTISFGHTPPDGDTVVTPLQADSGSSAVQHTGATAVYTSVPVHGPRLQVTLTNNQSEPVKVFAAWVYGVRTAP